MTDSITFWGVRGSIASPGASTALVGGNTTCVEVRMGGERIVLDGGTGLRELGAAQGHEPLSAATLLFSHLHWDHIQGIPFFGPLFDPRSRVTMRGPRGLEETLCRQMERPSFPVGMDVMGATMDIGSLEPGDELRVGDVNVRVALLPHPGGSYGYRIEHGGRAVVFATDVELTDAPGETLVDLARDADVLIVDAQYLPEELPAKRGWGHSSFDVVCRLADRARVRRLVLTHHDPTRDDGAVLAMEARARLLRPDSCAAREGMRIELSSGRMLVGSRPLGAFALADNIAGSQSP
ncbi:MAG: MBL fold metallo-hydrolase [Deltaproteobacteria bacterium]|nr:MBL fold metallo-hydrolase [Deltaproteobacteria bacterium]